MKEFQPTYLCIKRHSVTGLSYLCKTTKSYEQMLKYCGSGRPYWSNHLKEHKKEYIETPWFCLFYEKEEIEKFALMCSEQWDIVNSDLWANLKPENGTEGYGGTLGKKFPNRKKSGPQSIEHRTNISSSMKNKPAHNKGKPMPAGFSEKVSKLRKGRTLKSKGKPWSMARREAQINKRK